MKSKISTDIRIRIKFTLSGQGPSNSDRVYEIQPTIFFKHMNFGQNVKWLDL